MLCEEIAVLEQDIERRTQCDDAARRLMTIPGIGPITASAIVGLAGDASHYRSGREFAASLGLVPRQYATGGKPRLLGISKRGDSHLRRLLVQGARAVMQRQDQRHAARWPTRWPESPGRSWPREVSSAHRRARRSPERLTQPTGFAA